MKWEVNSNFNLKKKKKKKGGGEKVLIVEKR